MATFVAVMRVIAGALPSALLVIAVFLISTLALALGEERRKYALEVVDRLLKLAAVLVGLGTTDNDEADKEIDPATTKELEESKKEAGRHL